jgi:Heavy metal binding domain
MSSNTNSASAAPNFYCPMHVEINQTIPGLCPKCGMDLVPEGARFSMLRHMLSMPRHMLSRPWMLVVMGAAMAIMAALMMR